MSEPTTDALLTALRDRLARGGDPALARDLEQALAARRDERGGHAAWARLCEEAGLMALAGREWQLALRDDPADPDVAVALAQHYRERGDTRRAAELLEPLLRAAPAREDWLALYLAVLGDDGAGPRIRAALDRAVRAGLPPERARALRPETAAEPEDAASPLAPSDADCVRFHALFAGREDVHARQWAQRDKTGYSPVREPLTPAVIRNHLLGTYTVGVYPVRLDATCTFFALDLDLDKAAIAAALGRPEQTRALRDALRGEAARLLARLRETGFAPLFEDSGYKGRHFWIFLERPEPAEVLHRLGRLLLAWLTPDVPRGLHLEFFPKQGTLKGAGLGNLIKLPLGLHRRTGRRAALLDDAGQPLSDPLAALRQVVRLPQPALHAALDRLRALTGAVPDAGPPRAVEAAGPAAPPGPPPPEPPPAWTEADFDTDPPVRHLLAKCPVLAALKRTAEEHRRLSHEEQLVLVHTLGHLPAGPAAVNYLLGRCLDVGPEKFLKDRLKGNPVSCPSIRRKIGGVTRRLPCHCEFDSAPDHYPTPLLHLRTLPPEPPPPPAEAAPDPGGAGAEALARRFGLIAARRAQVEQEYESLRRALAAALEALPDRAVALPGGRYRLVEQEGLKELLWEPEAAP